MQQNNRDITARRHPHFTNTIARMSRAFVVVFTYAVLTNLGEFSEMIRALAEGFSFGEMWGYIAAAFGGLLVLLALVFLLYVLGWRHTWISMVDDTLVYENGVINKKRTVIPFAKINTIDMSRNLFQRVCGTCRLKLDTGALSDGAKSSSEMELIFSLADADTIRSYILTRKAGDDMQTESAGANMPAADKGEPKWTVRASFKDFFLYGLTDSSVFKLFVGLLAVFVFIGELSPELVDRLIGYVVPAADAAVEMLSRYALLVIVLIVLLAFVAVSLIANIWSIIMAAIRFYDFRVVREGRNIIIRYGLISLKSYTIPVDKVHACIIKQNLMQQILRSASVSVVSVGYGNETDETALLFPIIRLSKLDGLLEELLPEYRVECRYVKPEKKSIWLHIVRPMCVVTIALAVGVAVAALIFEYLTLALVVAVLIFALSLTSQILRYRKTGLGVCSTAVAVRSGGMRCTEYIIRRDAVQSVEATGGPLVRRLGQRNYIISYHSASAGSFAVAQFMPEKCFDMLAENISEDILD